MVSANVVTSGVFEVDAKNDFKVFRYVGSATISDLRASIWKKTIQSASLLLYKCNPPLTIVGDHIANTAEQIPP